MARPLPKNAWDETVAKKIIIRQPWMVSANCRDHPERGVFFTDRSESQTNVQRARQICSDCPVWNNCLRFALENNEEFGVWGGLSVRERQSIKRGGKSRRCVKCGLIRVFTKAQTICDQCNGTICRGRRPRG